MKKTIIKDNKLVVETNEFKNIFYNLKYDWGEGVCFNLNNNSTPNNAIYYIECFPNNKGADTYIGATGSSFEECEEKLWKEYMMYLNCNNHEFTRNSPDGRHYKNGVGFCIYCGMFKSDAFKPETTCLRCGLPTNRINSIGEYVCDECNKKEPFEKKYYYGNFLCEENFLCDERHYNKTELNIDWLRKTLIVDYDDRKFEFSLVDIYPGIYRLVSTKIPQKMSMFENMKYHILKNNEEERLFLCTEESIPLLEKRLSLSKKDTISYESISDTLQLLKKRGK